MSSILGHAAAGAAAYFAYGRVSYRSGFLLLPVIVFLAICPDLDYLALWILNLHVTPRFTHSLIFGVLTALAAWRVSPLFQSASDRRIPVIAFLAASLSHPTLDFLVGVHPVPWLWPFSDSGFVLPFGVLPSAGRLSIHNFFLWRNLIIELVILLPLLTLLVAISRRVDIRSMRQRLVVIVPVWIAFLAWSIRLPRA